MTDHYERLFVNDGVSKVGRPDVLELLASSHLRGVSVIIEGVAGNSFLILTFRSILPLRVFSRKISITKMN